MPEVKRDPVTVLVDKGFEGKIKYVCFDDEMSLSDIARWLLNNKSEAEEMLWLLQEGLNDSKRNTQDLS